MKAALQRILVLAVALALPASARAEAFRDRFSAGGYFRIMTRPDFQGGDSKLGYWNLYGRLLNEGPWGTLELKLDILQNNPGRSEAWASVHAKLEGGSFANTDPGRGNLGKYGATQMYVKAGNVLLENVTWQLGTLEAYLGDLGLYDMRPAQLFFETVGLSARYNVDRLELLLGFGDDGWAYRGADYSTMFTTGGWARLRLGGKAEVAAGGQYRFEPEVNGNRNAPYTTPGIRYEDFRRKKVVEQWMQENPGMEPLGLIPAPVAGASHSWKLIGYFGFGGVGPIRWNSLYANFMRMHPDNYYSDEYKGRQYTIYIRDLTDERYQLNLGNEMQISIVPEKLDAIWGVLGGYHFNNDNAIAAGDDNRTFLSTVLRLQYYATRTVHLLTESSIAREHSLNGNLYRQHNNSVRANAEGIPDTTGLQWGDSDTRDTWQLKTGMVLNPAGPGIFSRPSLRILYGLQYSTQQGAYGNAFAETEDPYNPFPAADESHWHSVVAVEAEAWF